MHAFSVLISLCWRNDYETPGTYNNIFIPLSYYRGSAGWLVSYSRTRAEGAVPMCCPPGRGQNHKMLNPAMQPHRKLLPGQRACTSCHILSAKASHVVKPGTNGTGSYVTFLWLGTKSIINHNNITTKLLYPNIASAKIFILEYFDVQLIYYIDFTLVYTQF